MLLRRRHGLPVESVAILLCPEAAGPELTGLVRLRRRDGTPYLEFHHGLVQIWRQSPDTALAGGLATLPFAPLADVPASALPELVRRIDDRLSREATPAEAGTLWTATYWLLGLRYPLAFARDLLRGVRAMMESTTYRATLAEGEAVGRAEGRIEEARRILLRLGTRRFGQPDARTQAALEAVADIEHIERLTDRLLDAASGDDLVATD